MLRWREALLTAAALYSFCATPPVVMPRAVSPQTTSASGLELYQTLKAFTLNGGSAVAENLVLKRDRVQMTFNGTFYFEAPVAGRVLGAVFVGMGNFRAEAPPLDFERDNVRRLLKSDVAESDFRTAVLRFTDDTFDVIGGKLSPSSEPALDVRKLAAEFESRMLKETGVNISSRLTLSLLNQEQPGFFVAQFDKGRRDRFTFLLDYQERIPVADFEINAGEKGLIFAHNTPLQSNDVWMAFASLDELQSGRVMYSDANDVIEIGHYDMDIDVREPGKEMRERVTMKIRSRVNALRAIHFAVNRSLPEANSIRQKKALRLTECLLGGQPLASVQEEWEGGFTVFLPRPVAAGEALSVSATLEGNSLMRFEPAPYYYYPRSTTDWYPTYGYLRKSTFDLTFHHRKQESVVSIGSVVRNQEEPGGGSGKITEWRLDSPVALATFALGILEPHNESSQIEGASVPLTFHSPPSYVRAVKEDFILAEMGNSLRFFSALFGPYQFRTFSAVYFPGAFGQGFPTLLLLPTADSANKRTFRFIAHETSHQWWGHFVTWRSYRDQWLSEGFADYSGIIYTQRRMDPRAARELIESLRRELLNPPETLTGIEKGPVANIGPLILGHRLASRASLNAYTTLTYDKGALVLRMLHFLFRDPQTGDDKPFFDMMSDFVRQRQNGWASTEDFIGVANSHFATTAIARRYQMKDLNWFFHEWVFQAYLPIYRLEYGEEPQSDGSFILRGTLFQDNTPNDWAMPLPLVLHFGKDKTAQGLVMAFGPKAPVVIKVPARPSKVELDPYYWVLSEKTTTKQVE